MSEAWEGGKGDKVRPMSISYEEFGNRIDKIFGRSKESSIGGIEESSKMEIVSGDYCMFLDDERSVTDARIEGKSLISRSNIPKEEWVIVRSYDEFVDIIHKRGIPRVVSFDNDLTESHLTACLMTKSDQEYQEKVANKQISKTGFHAMKYLFELCKSKGLTIPKYYIHTANPFARTLMENYGKENE